MKVNDIIVFIENHKWCGCLGIITEIKPSKIMVKVPVPMQGDAYIYVQPGEIEATGGFYPFKVSTEEV